jgi:hypothetical protein
MRHLLVLTAVVLTAFALASASSARLSRPTWTVAQVETNVANSNYFADNALDDLSCQGRGRAYLNPANEASYRVFRCTFYFEDDDDTEQTFTAYARVIGQPDRYSLYGFSDQSFNPNSNCYEAEGWCQ